MNRNRHHIVAGTVACAATLLAVGACGDSSDPEPGPLADVTAATAERFDNSYVGAIEGSAALIGITIDDDGAALAYVCDGDPTQLLETDIVYEWFVGRDDTITSRDGDAVLTLDERSANTITGSVALDDGTTHSFTATLAERSDGFFVDTVGDGTAQDYDIGWVKVGGHTTGHAKQRAISDGTSNIFGLPIGDWLD